MAPQPHFPLPLPKHWPRRVRSAAVHAIALARLALTHLAGLRHLPIVELKKAA